VIVKMAWRQLLTPKTDALESALVNERG
jgi:hypothetical protein